MTKSQIKAIEIIKKLAETLYGDMSKYEIKEWEIEECPYFVSLYVSVGMKNDERTMAVYCRDSAHLFIGKRGGIKYPVYKNGRTYTKVFHGYSLLEAVVEQRY